MLLAAAAATEEEYNFPHAGGLIEYITNFCLQAPDSTCNS
jgi:hypothetical protein